MDVGRWGSIEFCDENVMCVMNALFKQKYVRNRLF